MGKALIWIAGEILAVVILLVLIIPIAACCAVMAGIRAIAWALERVIAAISGE